MSINESNQQVGDRGIGVMFFAVFGTWWLCLGCRGLLGTNLVDLMPAVLLGAAVFLGGWVLYQRNSAAREQKMSAEVSQQRARISRVFRIVNVVQWLAIVALIVVLNLVHEENWIAPGIMLIVGLHFLPLASLFRTRSHYITGAAMSLLAVSYPWIAAQGPASPIGPLGAGLILITGACATLLATARPRAA